MFSKPPVTPPELRDACRMLRFRQERLDFESDALITKLYRLADWLERYEPMLEEAMDLVRRAVEDMEYIWNDHEAHALLAKYKEL